jgi:pilus assembly protein CpaB
MKSKIILIAAVVVGLVAFLLAGQYLKSEREKLYAGAEKTRILASARDLPAGTVLKFEDIGGKSVYKTAVGENVFRPDDLNLVLDKRLIYPLKAGEPLWWSHVDVPQPGRGGLSAMVKPGMRAISIAVSGAAAVSGLVRPNDHVDILGTFTFPSRRQAGETEAVTLTMLQDVTILATGTRLGRQGAYGSDTWSQQAGGFSTISLEVTPREAEMLTFAQHVKGQLVLALRNEDDVSFEKALPEVNFEMIEKNLPELNTYRQLKIRNKKNL